MIRRFPSVWSLADAAEKSGQMHVFSLSDCAGETAQDALVHTRGGDDSLVPQAEKLVGEFSAELETARSAWLPDVCGAYPMVPEFVAGIPECMRRRQMVPSEQAPLTIYVNVAASHACDAAMILQRGTAILAFVLAMSRIRPISLHVFVAAQRYSGIGDECIVTAPVNTAPLDVATAAYALTSAAFFRRIVYAIARQALVGSSAEQCSWPRAWRDDREAYNRGLFDKLGCDPESTLIIDGAFSRDALIDNPRAWLREQLAKFTGKE